MQPDAAPHGTPTAHTSETDPADPTVTVAPAAPGDVAAIASVFGHAFGDYRRALGCDAPTLAALWQPFIAARLSQWTVARVRSPKDGSSHVAAILSIALRGIPTIPVRQQVQAFRTWLDTVGGTGLLRAWYALLPLALVYLRRPPRDDELYVSLLAVAPKHQGKRLGQVLLTEAARQARIAGCRALSLHVAATNDRARRLYDRMGFVADVTFRPPYQGPMQIPAFIAMRRPLGETGRADR